MGLTHMGQTLWNSEENIPFPFYKFVISGICHSNGKFSYIHPMNIHNQICTLVSAFWEIQIKINHNVMNRHIEDF